MLEAVFYSHRNIIDTHGRGAKLEVVRRTRSKLFYKTFL